MLLLLLISVITTCVSFLLPPCPPAVVPLPSPEYSAQLSNTSVCQLVVEKTRVIGLDYGQSKLYLIDSSNASDRSVPAEISVVQPHRLSERV